MTSKQRNVVAVATTVLTLAGGGGVAWACNGPGDPGYQGTTTTTTTTGTTGTTGTTTTASSTGTTGTGATPSAVRRSERGHTRRAHHSRRSA
jgi:hypothetical protein